MVSLISAPPSAQAPPLHLPELPRSGGVRAPPRSPLSLWGKNYRPRPFLPEDSSPSIPLLGGGECICLHPIYLTSRAGGPQSKSSEMTVKLDFEECLKDSPRFR